MSTYGQIVDTSKSGGLPVKVFWHNLFQYNEACWIHRPDLLMEDVELRDMLVRAFPTRDWSRGLFNASQWRVAYNRGALSEGQIPLQRSRRYTIYGDLAYRWESGIPRRLWPTQTFEVTGLRASVDNIVRMTFPKKEKQ